MKFKDLGINDDIINILNKNGISTPTPIQEESIAHIKNGADVIAQAQTGTGKTLAFLLPIFDNISTNLNSTQVLILSPTRELAIQISEEANKLNEAKNINILAAYGGKDIGSQINKLKKNIHLIIATPGRLLDHLDRGTIDLSNIKTFVLDEADQMLLMGFKNEVEAILAKTSKKRQTLCFSATMNSQVKKLAYRYMNNPMEISIKKTEITLDSIKQEVVETTDRWKQESLFKVLNEDITKKMLTPHVYVNYDVYYGYGIWIIKREEGIYKYYLTGSDPGVTFMSAIYPEKDIVVNILGNREFSSFELSKKIEECFM